MSKAASPSKKAVSPSKKAKRAPSRSPNRGPIPMEEELYKLVTDAIVTKQIRPGARLKEATLARQFGVSRARVRAVLQRLAELGVIEFRLNQGALVRRPGPDEARAVFSTRRLIEAEVVRETAKHASKADFAKLRTFVRREELAFRRGDKGLPALSSGFHIMLGDLCRNPVLASILNQLVHRSVLIQALYERQNQNTVCLTHEHVDIIDLMANGRVRDAVAAMLHHIDHLERSLDYDRASTIDRRIALSIE